MGIVKIMLRTNVVLQGNNSSAMIYDCSKQSMNEWITMNHNYITSPKGQLTIHYPKL